MTDYTPDDPCPGCGHHLAAHTSDGCLHDWEYDEDGNATHDGCYCNLRLT